MNYCDSVCAVLLAAGDGVRMKSAKPKVLCEVLFRPMILWVADACAGAGIRNCAAVLGAGHERVSAVLPPHFKRVLQNERRGTGHAVIAARDYIREGGFEDAAVLCGDAPFIGAENIRAAFELHKSRQNAVTVISARVENPTGYGRIIRGESGVRAIVEQKDADAEMLEIDEISSGAYWFNTRFLLSCLDRITPGPQGEYYLTDTVAAAVGDGLRADAYAAGPDTVLGANDRRGLAMLNEIARARVLDALMDAGVDIPFPGQVVAGAEVKAGADSRLLPGTILRGGTVIGKGCEIGPNSHLQDAVVGDGCRITASCIESSVIGRNVRIGPMAYIRPGCSIADGVKLGDFVEVKNSVIGPGTSVAHLTYIGDSDVGAGCNFGCGTVTVNYDGAGKYRTVIGDGAFIGCNTNLIAPVRLGNRAYSAAGTTVTGDVPDDALVIGRARQCVKENWNRDGAKFKKGPDKK